MPDNSNISVMQAHVDAWNSHDVDALLDVMTEDCVYDAAAGSAPSGDRYEGHDALREAFTAIWGTFPNAQWADALHFDSGDYGVTVWTFRGTRADGETVEARGLDLLRFRDGLICNKDTFRKNVTT